MQILDSDGNVFTEWVSDGTIHTVTNIPAGSYILKEVASPDGFVISTEIKFSIDIYNNVTVESTNALSTDENGNSTITMVDDTTKVHITKLDIIGTKEIAGAELQLIDSTGTVIDKWTSTTEAHIIEGQLISGGTYTLHEEVSPDGYVVANDVTFTVSDNGSIDKVVMYDDTTKVRISKRDITNDEELQAFYSSLPQVPYVMEEFIEGVICSYDAIVDSRCEPVFETMTVWPPVMDIVLKDLDLKYYTCPEAPEKLRELGRKTVKAFQVSRRFVHLEFFRLTRPHRGLGDVGDFVALEVNMRPAGGYTPDMINFARSVDVYQIYADMVTKDARVFPEPDRTYYCAYASRKDGHTYTHTHEEIMAAYGTRMVMQEEMPPMNWPQMGRYMYTARLDSLEDTQAFIHFVLD